jgi:RHS repeat-associated protein
MRSSATLTYCDIRYSQAKAIHRLVYESYVLLCAQNLLNGIQVKSANPVLEKETFTTVTEYDALNRATEIRTPHSDNIPASKIMPAYDEGGLLKTVNVNLRGAKESTGFVSDIKYNPKGQRERITYGNGATTRYTYDEKTFRLKQLLTTRNNGTDVLQDLNYTYDQMGNITKITDNAQQTIYFNGAVVNPSQTFEYDALYRLVKATGREHASINADSEPEIEGYNQALLSPEDGGVMRLYQRQWEYDNVGNILNLIHKANNNNWNRSYNYATSNNRLLSTEVGQTEVSYTYNEHGSMATMPHLQNMEWNFAEQLSHITRGTTEAYYSYDNSGQRTRKVVEKGNVIEERLYLGGFEVFRKKSGNTIELERETLHIMDDVKRIAVVETKTVDNGTAINNPTFVQRYQLGNNIESATLELDENANIISYEEYYPYGETSYRAGRSVSEVSQKRYRYTGKEKDEESGLYYYGARYYACWLGRWTAADPAGLVDGLNLYMYCRGSPLNRIDPNGMYNIETGKIDPGDNLTKITSKINKEYGTDFSINDIAKANNIENPDYIRAGDKISLKALPIKEGLGEKVYNEVRKKIDNLGKKDNGLVEIDKEIGSLLQKVFNKYETKLRVYATNATKIQTNKVFEEYGVFINVKDKHHGIEGSASYEAYQSIFHELFHNVDFCHTTTGNISERENGLRYEFAKTIVAEANKSFAYIEEHRNLPELNKAYLFDIMGGATKNWEIDGYGHSYDDYWGKVEETQIPILLSAETFANMASAAVTNYGAFKTMKKELPKSYMIFKKILKEMVK